ncbi:MAG: GatB/YqeY domain-containing protein [Chitinivibrionales bacterium]|nr:GatB/YqeY domain-containing protein [Chitinivibrionales bacterium]MBD3394216.1 GatB/YqeY domain-containing protein [Chitinivibrionales bacterium]
MNRIQEDIKIAMKAGKKDDLLALRTLLSEIKNLGINERRELSDEDVAAVIAKAIKQRRDSIEQFKNGGRHDLAAKEQEQIDLYTAYRPAQLERAEIEQIVAKAIADTGASSRKQMGMVMQQVMPQVKGRADGALVNRIVSEKLP